jgi:hypothetical protein
MDSAWVRWMVVVFVLASASALAACTKSASRGTSDTRAPVPATSGRSGPLSPAPPTGDRCRSETFDIALPSEDVLTGVSSPIEAAKRFVALNPGWDFGTPTPVWRVTDQGPQGAEVTNGVLWFEALRLRDKTWVIDKGSRCR